MMIFHYIKATFFLMSLTAIGWTEGIYCSGNTTHYIDGSCVTLHHNSLSWDDAKKNCEDEGTQLLQIPDRKFQASVSSLFIHSPLESAWIGLRKTQNFYQWTDCSKVNYTNWMNESAATTASENKCVALSPKNNSTWAIRDCHSPAPAYFCQNISSAGNSSSTSNLELPGCGDDDSSNEITDNDETSEPSTIKDYLVYIVASAVVGVFIIIAIILAVIFVRNRKASMKQRNESKDDGQEDNDEENDGRTTNQDGLVYITVDHAKRSRPATETEPGPRNQKKSKVDKVEYVTVDFSNQATGSLGAGEGKNEMRTANEDGLVYITVEHAKKPTQPATSEALPGKKKKPKADKVEYVSVDFSK